MKDFHDRPNKYFVGREKELSWISQTIKNNRMAIISGGGGIGKTSLAMKFANIFQDEFPSGIFNFYFNSFESLSNQISENGLENATQPFLLILDEHEVSLSDTIIMSEVGSLLKNTPSRIIITSRQPIQTSFGDNLELTNFTQAEMEMLINLQLGNSNLDRFTLDKFYEIFQGHPLAVKIASGALHDGILSISELLQFIKPFAKPGLVDLDNRPLDPDSKPFKLIVNDVALVSDKLLYKLSKNPELLYELPPRLFEEVVAELLRLQGYEVTITPMSRDGGKDIYVANKNSLGSFLYIVECKRHSPDNPVGVRLIRELYGVVQAEKATAGILATTSYFTKDAIKFQQQISNQISLQDYLGIQKWLNKTQ